MKISILTATYNRAKLLDRLYTSIIVNNNNCEELETEWLIMDDGSTDNTKRIVGEYIKEGIIDIKYYNQENKGKMTAINELVKNATGDIMVECDSDDYFTEDAFNIILSSIRQCKDMGNVYALVFLKYDQDGNNMGNEFFDVSLYPLLNAWVYVGENNQKKAILSLKPLLEVKGLESIYYLHEGLILDYFGENAKATAAYTKLEKSPDGQSLRSMMVMYDFYRRLNLLNQKEEFLKAYQTTQNSSFVSKDMMTNPKEKYRALSAADGISMVFFDIGSFVSQTENYETALYLIQLAIYLNPESSINKLFLGEVLEAMGQYQMANVVYRSFPKGKDLYRSMQLRLVLSLQKIGQLNEAKNELIHLIQEYPNIPLYYMTLGDVYRDMEEYQKSLKAYEKAFDTFQLKEDPQAADCKVRSENR